MSDRPLTFEDFSTRVNGRFAMRDEHDRVSEVILLECTRLQLAGGPRSFTLLFRGGPDAPAAQGTYLLSADGFEPAPIFLVPARRTSDGVEYHAVFNHTTEDENVP